MVLVWYRHACGIVSVWCWFVEIYVGMVLVHNWNAFGTVGDGVGMLFALFWYGSGIPVACCWYVYSMVVAWFRHGVVIVLVWNGMLVVWH